MRRGQDGIGRRLPALVDQALPPRLSDQLEGIPQRRLHIPRVRTKWREETSPGRRVSSSRLAGAVETQRSGPGLTGVPDDSHAASVHGAVEKTRFLTREPTDENAHASTGFSAAPNDAVQTRKTAETVGTGGGASADECGEFGRAWASRGRKTEGKTAQSGFPGEKCDFVAGWATAIKARKIAVCSETHTGLIAAGSAGRIAAAEEEGRLKEAFTDYSWFTEENFTVSGKSAGKTGQKNRYVRRDAFFLSINQSSLVMSFFLI